MSTATFMQDHIAHESIEGPHHQVMVIEFVSSEITNPVQARELGAQLSMLILPHTPQYFVIDCTGLRSLGSTAFSEILSFVHSAKPVWICNLDHSLRSEAFAIGLENWARFAANRPAAIAEAERTARWDEEDAAGY
jgi:hypothetical protein